jgi:tRNA uridine 5-carboxymethylaminomethyl modification enzyme
MFTSRAEYRLLLREDNADLRLSGTGRLAGLLPEERYRRFLEKREGIDAFRKTLEEKAGGPGAPADRGGRGGGAAGRCAPGRPTRRRCAGRR